VLQLKGFNTFLTRLTSSLNSYLRVSIRKASSAPYMRGWSCRGRQHPMQCDRRSVMGALEGAVV